MSDAVYLGDVTDAAVGSLVELTGTEAHHALVKRSRVGESIIISDGAGHAVRGDVVTTDSKSLSVAVTELLSSAPSNHRWVAVQALVKGDRSELAVEMLTELGVDEILAWQADRSIVRWRADRGDKGLEKWQTAAREATKQSRRYRIPLVRQATGKEVCDRIEKAALALILHESATVSLGEIELPEMGEILFIVGPEGGISPSELDAFIACGAVPVLISDGILRASPAGVVALARMQGQV